MVVFLFTWNRNPNRKSGDIEKDIENPVGFNIKCEHNPNHREEITGIYDGVQEAIERENASIINAMTPTKDKINLFEEFKSINQRNKKSQLPRIIIDDDVVKFDKTKLKVEDIADSISFGNRTSQLELRLKDGQVVFVNACVFPHASENAVKAKIAQLKGICEQ